MKLTWLIIFFQSCLISYLLFWPRLSTASLKSSLKLESLRTAAGNSALMPMNPSSQVSSQVLNEKNCRLGFGFASLVDIRARLVDFVSSFQPPAEARHHETINSRQEMLETLAFCFVAGRAAEFRIPKELFEEVMRKMEGVQHWKTLGGNGASMSKRASHEGCLAYLASPITSEMKGYFDQKRTVFLNEDLESPDFHVILEYREGETWGRYVASRSNRFYVNHDNHNINPKVFQTINLPEPLPVFALGGFQLLEGSPKEDEFLSSALSKINSLKSSKVKIHFEMGDFHSISFFSKLQALIKESDSIGFNEQELGILLCHLKKIKFGGYPSKAPVKKYLSDLSDLISSLSSSSYKASRLHLHTLSIQAICSTDEWSNPLKASARSALLAGQFACNRTDIQSETFSFYEGNDWKEEEVTKCWKEEKMTCCLALNPTCTQVVQVSGLGDNISAMGLVYHELRL